MGIADWLFGPNSFAGELTGAVSGVTAQNATARDVARQQQDFQAYMSNTAHQREAEDLKKAGFNPILSAGGGGSSTPSGTTYQPQAVDQLKAAESAYNTAKSINDWKNQNRMTDAQVKQIEASTAAINASSAKDRAIQPAYDAGGKLLQSLASGVQKNIDFSKIGKSVGEIVGGAAKSSGNFISESLQKIPNFWTNFIGKQLQKHQSTARPIDK